VSADRAAAQGHVKMGYPGFTGLPDDHAAFELMNYIFCGAGQGSRLFQRLRTEKGLTAAVYCEADPRLDGPATYEIRFSGNPPTVAEAIWQTCEDLETIVREGVTREEFERARTAFLEGHIPWMYDSPHRVATRFAEKALLGRYDYTRSNYLNYSAGDAEQVEAVRRTTLRAGQRRRPPLPAAGRDDGRGGRPPGDRPDRHGAGVRARRLRGFRHQVGTGSFIFHCYKAACPKQTANEILSGGRTVAEGGPQWFR
jgi:hypothetical protein